MIHMAMVKDVMYGKTMRKSYAKYEEILEIPNMLKIQKACDLLHDTTKNSTEIALDCGFNSTMYFCKTFKSILGMTPSEYRSM